MIVMILYSYVSAAHAGRQAGTPTRPAPPSCTNTPSNLPLFLDAPPPLPQLLLPCPSPSPWWRAGKAVPRMMPQGCVTPDPESRRLGTAPDPFPRAPPPPPCPARSSSKPSSSSSSSPVPRALARSWASRLSHESASRWPCCGGTCRVCCSACFQGGSPRHSRYPHGCSIGACGAGRM